jgi:hypothetical protein
MVNSNDMDRAFEWENWRFEMENRQGTQAQACVTRGKNRTLETALRKFGSG